MKANLKVRLSAEANYTADVLVDVTMMADWGGLPLKKTNGWETIDLGEILLKAGDNKIRFTPQQNINLNIDFFSD